MIICRCEEVSYGTLKQTADTYKCSARELKLRTRASMGYCGGRSCRSMVDAFATKTYPEQERTSVSLKYQPPIRPIRFDDLGSDQK